MQYTYCGLAAEPSQTQIDYNWIEIARANRALELIIMAKPGAEGTAEASP